uniref:glucuronosyltransferase n=1 Tax=Steinernema glaseri TaxID=37863 RepID=A0A1I7YLD6_9BILA
MLRAIWQYVRLFHTANLQAQPKTRAFITHCGLNSLTESIYAGVPLLGIPIFGDQRYNAAIIQHRELGVYLNIEEVTEDRVYDALEKLLHTEKYRTNAKNVKEMMRKWPKNPKEEVKKWVQFAAEFPDLTELNIYGSELDTITYHNLDIIGALFVSVALFLASAVKMGVAIFSFVFAARERKMKVQ